MTWKLFAFFFVIALVWLQSDGGWWFYNLTIALFLSPVLAIFVGGFLHLSTQFFAWLGKSKPKDGWWKDAGGY
jgi:hypothetical protein